MQCLPKLLAKPLKNESFFSSSEKVGQSLRRPEPAESELLARMYTWPLHTPAQAVVVVVVVGVQRSGELRGSWGGMLSLLGSLPTQGPHPATIPGSATTHLHAEASGLGLGWAVPRWRASSQGRPMGRAAELTSRGAGVGWGKAAVRPQLQAQELEVCSALTVPPLAASKPRSSLGLHVLR